MVESEEDVFKEGWVNQSERGVNDKSFTSHDGAGERGVRGGTSFIVFSVLKGKASLFLFFFELKLSCFKVHFTHPLKILRTY
jgi:hypothetical protein